MSGIQRGQARRGAAAAEGEEGGAGGEEDQADQADVGEAVAGAGQVPGGAAVVVSVLEAGALVATWAAPEPEEVAAVGLTAGDVPPGVVVVVPVVGGAWSSWSSWWWWWWWWWW